DPQGSRRALQAEIGGFNEGSDHEVWAEGSWRVPVLYIADWPDRYIHTQRDVPGNLDPTKLRRAIFIAAASGWYLANVTAQGDMLPVVQAGEIERAAQAQRRVDALRARGAPEADIAALWRTYRASERAAIESFSRFGIEVAAEPAFLDWVIPRLDPAAPSGPVYRRVLREGPMNGFGYSWFDDRLARAHLPRPRLLAREPDGEGASLGYEALNLVDGQRSVGEIRDALAATVGAAPQQEVAEYLDILARLGVIEVVQRGNR
ncbi:MAG TPA: hypothetical protein VEW04_06520, partial [Allosphingosinicella sp.]|nr:hypothetical protein [Allosphingosinicella sp.]